MTRNRMMCVALLGLCLAASCHPKQTRVSGALFRGPINAAGETSPSTVLIVPTNEADKAVQQKIHEDVRDVQELIEERMPGRNVKIMTDAEALRSDLSQGALSVYGTPRGNLWLARYIATLPVAIEPNAIIADRLYKGSNLRFISTWHHPQNPKLGMVIYTAQRAEDVVGINSIHHGPTDYLVAQGQTIIRAADYINKDGRWTFPSLELGLAQATEDLDFLFKTIEQVHPNCRANLSRTDYKRLKERSLAALQQASDDKGRVPIRVLALTAAEAVAALGDGHTGCHLPADLIDRQDPSPCMPPFRLRWDAGHVTIDKTVAGLEHLTDTHLLRINGEPFDRAVAPILARFPGERQEFRMMYFLNQQEVCWALIRLVQGQEITVTVRRGMNEPRSVKVPLISLARYGQELPSGPRRDRAGFHEFHDDGRTCYWQYNSFDPSDTARKAVDAVFKDIRERNARNLIIDLRFNGGGSTAAADHILSYLTTKPYRNYSRVDVRLSRQFLAVQRSGLPGPVAWLLRGHLVSARGKYTKPADPGYKFEGSVYALVGPGTFSSAADFAGVLQDFHIGTLAGEETGGLRQCFGDCPTFHTPHGNLAFTVSTKRFYAPTPKPGDATHGSRPDLPIAEADLAPFADAGDPSIAFLLDYIKERREAE